MPSPAVSDRKVCAVDECPALPLVDAVFCPVHRYARRMSHVFQGPRCLACKREITSGEWVTPWSTTIRAEHAHCVKPQPRYTKQKDRLF